jgi:hypothetical protein
MKPQEHEMYSHEECFLVSDEDGVESVKANDAVPTASKMATKNGSTSLLLRVFKNPRLLVALPCACERWYLEGRRSRESQSKAERQRRSKSDAHA